VCKVNFQFSDKEMRSLKDWSGRIAPHTSDIDRVKSFARHASPMRKKEFIAHLEQDAESFVTVKSKVAVEDLARIFNCPPAKVEAKLDVIEKKHILRIDW